MKKILIVLAGLAVFAGSAFAQDALGQAKAAADSVPQSLQGTWYDKKYDCNWVLSVNATATGLAKLVDASTGSVYFTFTKNNVQNFKQEYDMTNGAVISFECDATHRTYKFVKPISGTPDLNIEIHNRINNDVHQPTIVFKGADIK